MLRKKYSLRDLAVELGRAVSTISDEVERNRVKGQYDAQKAHHKATLRSKKSAGFRWKKIVEFKESDTPAKGGGLMSGIASKAIGLPRDVSG